MKSKLIGNKIEDNISLKTLFGFCFLFLIVNFFINLCMPFPFAKGLAWRIILNIGYVLIFLVDLILIARCFRECKKILVCEVYKNKWILLFLAAYLIWDLINFIYADHFEYAAGKIMSMIEFFLILINFVLYTSWRDINKVFLCLGLTSLGISVVYLVGFLTGDYCFYLRKISALSDYNVSSTAILLGTIANFYIATRNGIPMGKRLSLFFLNFVLNIPVVLLSGSRKNLVIICGLILFYVCVFLVKAIYQTQKKFCNDNRLKKRMLLVFTLIFTICSMGTMVFLLKSYSDNRYEQYLSGSYTWVRYGEHEQGDGEIIRETDVKERYETIRSGESSNARMIIWKTSLNWIKEMSTLEKVIGGGNSHNSEIFDDLDHPINQKCRVLYADVDDEEKNWLYPHNIVLGDMLDGGIIKIILLFGVILTMIFKVCKSIFYKSEMGFAVLWIGGTILIMLMTSGSLGLFGNKFFWIPFSLTLGLEQAKPEDAEGR